MAITAGINCKCFLCQKNIINVFLALNAVFSVTLYTTIANFPQSYLVPYLTGSTLARITTSSLQILSLASGLSTENSALLYFSAGLAVIGFTLIYIIWIGRNKFYLYQMRSFSEGHKEKRISLRGGWELMKRIWSPIAIMGTIMVTVNGSPTALVVSEGEGQGIWNGIFP